MGIKMNFNAKDFKEQLKKDAKTTLEKDILAAIKKIEPTAFGVKVSISDDLKKIKVTGVSQEVVDKALAKIK